MALIITRAISSVQPRARQILLSHASRGLPVVTQVVHLTSTGGEPAKRKYPFWPYEKRRYNEFWQFFDHTRKRFDDNTKVIIIEGSVHVGKTEFGAKVAKEFDMKFFPNTRDENIFTVGEEFDLRSLNEQLPARARFCDMQTFYRQEVHPLTLKNFGRTILKMYMYDFMNYAIALEHLLNTGQGVVLERGAHSHPVFFDVLRKFGHLTPEGYKYLNFVYDNTICELWRPHLFIYLDAPVENIRKHINTSNDVPVWEAQSTVLTNDFLQHLETTYKEKFLPKMRKYSDVMTIDMTDLPEWDIMVEDLEARELDVKPFDSEDKFADWNSDFEDDFNRVRMDLGKKWQVRNRFSMSLPYEAPELMVHIDDWPVYRNVVEEHPEVKFRPGYNPEKYNVLLKW